MILLMMIQICHLFRNKHYTGLAASSLPRVKKHDNTSWIVHKCRKLLLKHHLNFKTSLLKKIIWQRSFNVERAILKSLSSYNAKGKLLMFKQGQYFYVVAVRRPQHTERHVVILFWCSLIFFSVEKSCMVLAPKVSRQILQGIILKGIRNFQKLSESVIQCKNSRMFSMKQNHRQNSCLFVNGSNLLSLDKSIKSLNQLTKSMYQFIKTSNGFIKSMDWSITSSLWFKSFNYFGKAHQFLTLVQTSS